MMPAGMVETTISQATFSVGVSILRRATERAQARIMCEPVPPEVGKQSQGAPDVEHDHEAEPV